MDLPARFLSSRLAPIVFGALTALEIAFVWGSLSQVAIVHDEEAYLLQGKIFATGHWTAPARPLPEFFEQFHVLVTPVFAGKYPPGHSLLIAPGNWVGLPGLMPVVLAGIAGALLFVLARRFANPWVALLTWAIWTTAPGNLRFLPTYFSQNTTVVLWLAGWWALAQWLDRRGAGYLVMLSACVAWGVFTRPFTTVGYAAAAGVLVLREVVRRKRWRDAALALVPAVLILGLIPLWSLKTTGQAGLTPYALYSRIYFPYQRPGFGLPPSEKPLRELPPDMQKYGDGYRPLHAGHTLEAVPKALAARVQGIARDTWGPTRWPLTLFAVLGLLVLPAAGWFAPGDRSLLAARPTSPFAHPWIWSLYYLELQAPLAFVTALGLGGDRLARGEAAARAARGGPVRLVGSRARRDASADRLCGPGGLGRGPGAGEGLPAGRVPHLLPGARGLDPRVPRGRLRRHGPGHNEHLSLIVNGAGPGSREGLDTVRDRGSDNERLRGEIAPIAAALRRGDARATRMPSGGEAAASGGKRARRRGRRGAQPPRRWASRRGDGGSRGGFARQVVRCADRSAASGSSPTRLPEVAFSTRRRRVAGWPAERLTDPQVRLLSRRGTELLRAHGDVAAAISAARPCALWLALTRVSAETRGDDLDGSGAFPLLVSCRTPEARSSDGLPDLEAALFAVLAVVVASSGAIRVRRACRRRARWAGPAGLCRTEWGLAAAAAGVARGLALRREGEGVPLACARRAPEATPRSSEEDRDLSRGGADLAQVLRDGHLLFGSLPCGDPRLPRRVLRDRRLAPGPPRAALFRRHVDGRSALLLELLALGPGQPARRACLARVLAILLAVLALTALAGGAAGAVVWSAAPAVCAAALVAGLRRRPGPRAAALAAFGLLGLIFLPEALSHRRLGLRRAAASLRLRFRRGSPALASGEPGSGRGAPAGVRRARGALAAAVVAAFAARLAHYRGIEASAIAGTSRMLTARPELAREVEALAASIRHASPPGSGLVVFPEGELLNFLSGRPNPVRHKLYLPGYLTDENEAQVLEELQAAKPAAIVLGAARLRSTHAQSLRRGLRPENPRVDRRELPCRALSRSRSAGSRQPDLPARGQVSRP